MGDLLLIPPGRPIMSRPAFDGTCLDVANIFTSVPARIVMVIACHHQLEPTSDDVSLETSWPWALVAATSQQGASIVGWVWLGSLDRAGSPRKL